MINWGSPYVSKPFKWHFSDEVLHEKNGESSKPRPELAKDLSWGQHRSIYKPSPFFRGQMRDHMLEKVRLNQLQEWWRCTSQKENKGILLQTNCYLYCYRRHCSHFLVNQIASYLNKLKIVKIILKRRDTYQLKQKTSTIARFYHCKNTSKVVAKHTYSSVRVIGYGYGTFLQAWNTLGELC